MVARAFGDRTVANADDLEVLRKTGGHPNDHVVDQSAGQPVQGTVAPLVVGPFDHEHLRRPGGR